MIVNVLKKEDISDIESEAIENGSLKILPYDFWNQYSDNKIQQFCLKHALYNIPTVEQVEFLKERIEGKKALEICSGNGVLADSLGIMATDNKIQEQNFIKYIYTQMGQPTIKYGENVLCVDANDVVRKFSPEVIIGAWVSERYSPNYPDAGGNAHGPIQRELIKKVDAYYLIGNLETHAHPAFLESEHTIHRFPMVSRRGNLKTNVIFEFKNHNL